MSKNINNSNNIVSSSNINNNNSLLSNWQNNGLDIYYDTGSVIVGKTYKNLPNFTVDISGSLNCNEIYVNNAPMDISGVIHASSLILNNSTLVPSWSSPSGGNIYYNGSVAINKTTPSYPLDVNGVINADSDIYSNGSVGIGTKTPAQPLHISGIQPNILMTDTETTNANEKHWASGPSYNNFFMTLFNDSFTASTIWMQAQRSGMNMTKVCFDTPLLGINNDSPAANLDVGGNIIASNNITCNTLNTTKIGVNNTSPTYNLDISGNLRTTSNIICSGNIGIGTTTPSYNLDINGSLRTSKLYLNNTPILSVYGATTSNTANNSTILVNPTLEGGYSSSGYNFTNGVFTPTVQGYYLVNMSSGSNAGFTGTVWIGVMKNNILYKIVNRSVWSGQYTTSAGSCIVYCNGTGDYFSITLFSSANYTASGNSAIDYLQITYLRSG